DLHIMVHRLFGQDPGQFQQCPRPRSVVIGGGGIHPVIMGSHHDRLALLEGASLFPADRADHVLGVAVLITVSTVTVTTTFSPRSSRSLRASPSSSFKDTAGISVGSPSVPLTFPGSLLKMIAPTAPAFAAFWVFS